MTMRIAVATPCHGVTQHMDCPYTGAHGITADTPAGLRKFEKAYRLREHAGLSLQPA